MSSNKPSSSSSSSSGRVQDDEPSPPGLFPIFQKKFRPQPPGINEALALDISPTSVANSRKRKRTMLSKKDPEGMTQMVLDAGQKHIGPTLCKECGLLFSPGDFVDEEEHRKAHLRIDNTFKLSLWKNAHIVFNYEDGCQILMVQCDKEMSLVKGKLKGFLLWLDSELGGGYDPSGMKPTERIFLYVARTPRGKNTVRILGCAIMEVPNADDICTSSLVRTKKIRSPPSESNGGMDMDEELELDVQQRKMVIGVTRLWTDSGFRRKRIASKLCEMMRFHSGILGCVVAKGDMGILEPSESGKAFMLKYTETKGVMYTIK